MKLITKENINFKDCLAQASRFADDEFKLTIKTLPKDLTGKLNATYGKAEIIVNIKSLMFPSFKATIQYVQNWNEVIEVDVLDENTNEPTGEKENVDQPQSKIFVEYNMELPYETIENILNSVDAFVSNDVVSKERTKQKVMIAILSDVVTHKTFKTDSKPDGLLNEDYTMVIL